ncbi:MAG TPA: ABC transporter permease subunit [Vicinamibacterales bacterium]|nr:ABC transporter permease subunit [Vicinamibacterales bacterium]
MVTRTPGLGYASLRVFDLSLAEMLWSRRTIFMGLVVGLPVLLALVVRVLVDLGAPIRVQGGTAAGDQIFGLMMWVFFVRFAVPVLAVFYGTSLIADEVEDKTITYLFSRPIPRGAVLLGKYLAYLACTVFVVLPAIVLVWLLVAPINGSLAATFPSLLTDLALVLLGLSVYGALFALFGTVLKRPLLAGLIYVFGWETFALLMPGALKKVSIAYYMQGLVPHAMPGNSAVSLIQSIVRDIPTLTESLFYLGLILFICLWLATRAIGRKEYVLEQ